MTSLSNAVHRGAASPKAINVLAADPEKDKDLLVDVIATAVHQQIDAVSRDEIKAFVHTTYEELLDHATVSKHISALVEGIVKRHFRDRMR